MLNEKMQHNKGLYYISINNLILNIFSIAVPGSNKSRFRQIHHFCPGC